MITLFRWAFNFLHLPPLKRAFCLPTTATLKAIRKPLITPRFDYLWFLRNARNEIYVSALFFCVKHFPVCTCIETLYITTLMDFLYFVVALQNQWVKRHLHKNLNASAWSFRFHFCELLSLSLCTHTRIIFEWKIYTFYVHIRKLT